MSTNELEFGAPPKRTALLPFFYTPPLALVGVGALLVFWGQLALSSPWSSYTLALTHLFTLGFLSMSCIGLVYLLLAVSGGTPPVALRFAHTIFWLFLTGLAGLVWGTAKASSGPVFFAIGAVGLMSVMFLWQAVRSLRRIERRSLTRRGLALALWGFAGVIFLGLWLAHGHGGMRFPGPRALWIQVHLQVGLLAWVGGLVIALSSEAWPALTGGTPISHTALRGLSGLILAGLAGSMSLLLWTYFFLPGEMGSQLAPWVLCFSAPMPVGVWLLHPRLGLRGLAGVPESAGLLYWRTGLGLAPFALLAGGVAWWWEDARLTLLFGWLALWGWGALLICGSLVAAVPGLLRTVGATPTRAGETWLRIGFGLHLAALVTGGVGIVSQRDDWIRVAGVLILVHGLQLGVWLILNLRERATELQGPANRRAGV